MPPAASAPSAPTPTITAAPAVEKIVPAPIPEAPAQIEPVKVTDTKVVENLPKAEPPAPVTDVTGNQKRPKSRTGRRDYGTVTIITPYQGDPSLEIDGLSSFFDNGVRYNVNVQRCSKKLRSMYMQCYYPKDKPRPPVYNW